MNPRPYQSRCVDAIRDAWLNHQSVLAVLATGLGKTVIAALTAKNHPNDSVLMFAHRDELVRQAAEKLEAVCGARVGIEMAEERSHPHSRIVVGSVQTLCKPGRRARLPRDRFTRIIIDEAHHAVARSYRDVLDHFDQARILGITATPRRADQLAMGQVFEHVAFDYGIEPAIKDGYLVPVEQHAVKVEGLDFSNLRSVRGDFSPEELERILTEEMIPHRMALPALELAGDAPGIFFCASVKHALLMESILNRHKPGCAKALSGETSKEERREWVERYKDGKVQWLCNCGLFLEGFDAPHTRIIVQGRPTSSLALYTQVLGRGTRPLPGLIDCEELHGEDQAEARRQAIASSSKPHCIVLDFVGNAGKHKICSALDVLGGEYGEPARAYARKTIAEEGKGSGTDESLARAVAELALEEEEMRRRARIKPASATYDTHRVSPFDHTSGSQSHAEDRLRGEPATPRQVNLLVYRFGWQRSKAESLTKRQAQRFIGKLMESKPTGGGDDHR